MKPQSKAIKLFSGLILVLLGLVFGAIILGPGINQIIHAVR